jgi:hypothetical protein
MLLIVFIILLFISTVKSRNCLLLGDSLNIGDSLISNNGLYNLTLSSRGNLCIYDNINTRWCTGFRSPSIWKMYLNLSGVFGIIKTNNICIWAPNYPVTSFMYNIQYLIMSDNGNFIVYDNTGLVWSCNRGTFSKYITPVCPITSGTESVGDTCNNIPSSIPTINPSLTPTINPILPPSLIPTIIPTRNPTINPTRNPTRLPSTPVRSPPTSKPIIKPTVIPTL